MAESFVERMRRQAVSAPRSSIQFEEEKTRAETRTCPDCGAPRSEADGVGECSYCGHVFVAALATEYARDSQECP